MKITEAKRERLRIGKISRIMGALIPFFGNAPEANDGRIIGTRGWNRSRMVDVPGGMNRYDRDALEIQIQ